MGSTRDKSKEKDEAHVEDRSSAGIGEVPEYHYAATEPSEKVHIVHECTKRSRSRVV